MGSIRNLLGSQRNLLLMNPKISGATTRVITPQSVTSLNVLQVSKDDKPE